MMMNKLYYLKDVSVDEMIETHVNYVTSEVTEMENLHAFADAVCRGKRIEPIYKVVKASEPAPRKAILYPKYMFLMHQIIYQCMNSGKNVTTLHYGVYTEILGKHFHDMLIVLRDMGIIELTSHYEIGVTPRKVRLKHWDVGSEEMKHKKVLEYLQQYYDLTGRIPKHFKRNKAIKKKPQMLPSLTVQKDEFTEQYTNSLKELKLVKKEEALQFIESLNLGITHQHQYYIRRIEKFDEENLKISKIDNDGRIYHYLTNFPKKLKKFLNIKYQLDISNSHPLLFSLFLINYYKINKNILTLLYSYNNNINNINNKIYNIRHVGKQLYKLLKNSNIEKSKLTEIPKDVLAYIYMTSKGVFWDAFTEMVGSDKRDEMKVNLFREVFYSKSTTAKNREFAKIFVKCFPKVWRVIRKLKMMDRTKLSHMMMQWESQMFRDILQECWKRGYKAINIHDAVIVLDCPENATVSNYEVEKVMMDVYEAHGLRPTIKTDVYQ